MATNPLFRSIFQFDRTGWRPGAGAIRFLAVTLAVVVPTALGQHGAAVLSGMGALYAGMASFGGVHQARLRRMLATTLVAASLTAVGCLVGGSDVATIAAVVLGAFAASLFTAMSPASGLIALQGTGVLIVLSGIPGVGANPWGSALFVLMGGILQAILIALVAPIAPTAAERRAVADAFGSLARWIAQLAEPDPPAIPAPAPFQEAKTHLDEAARFKLREEHGRLLHALLGGERIRATLVGWARYDREAEDRQAVERALLEIEAGLRQGSITVPTLEFAPTEDQERARWNGRLQKAFKGLGEEPAAPAAHTESWVPRLPAWPDSETLRALILGHALRYTIALGLATAAYRLAKMPHGYWIPLTVAFVLRPDYATTLTRGLARVAGTLVGASVATAIVALLHPSPLALTAAMLGAVWLAFSVFRASFTAFTATLTLYIVFSVAAAGVFDPMLGELRLLATAAGVVIALVAAIVWPNWEARKVKDVLRDAAEAQVAYGEAIGARSRGEASPEEVEEALWKARRLGIEAQRIVDAAGLEPRWGRGNHLAEAPEAMERIYENAAILLAADADTRSLGGSPMRVSGGPPE